MPGDFIEAGVALGGSGVLLANLMGRDRRFRGFDVFGMIPAPSERDPVEVQQRYDVIQTGKSEGLGDDVYYGYQEDLLGKVTRTFEEFNEPVGDRVTLHKGLFEDTLDLDVPVALAHIDCDWYDSVTTCLTQIAPRLSRGGFIVLDDYYVWGGCRDATHAFLATNPDFELIYFGTNVALVYRET